MKFKSSILITILLSISTQCSAAFVEAPPAYSERPAQPSLIAAEPSLVTTQPPVVTAQPTLIAAQPQSVIIQRTTICPQCGCPASDVIRVLVCLGTPVILPVAFGAGAVHGCACGGLEACGQVSKKANKKGDFPSACCTCCCCPCICIGGTIAETGAKAIKYVTAVIRFITSSENATASKNATASEDSTVSEDAPND